MGCHQCCSLGPELWPEHGNQSCTRACCCATRQPIVSLLRNWCGAITDGVYAPVLALSVAHDAAEDSRMDHLTFAAGVVLA
jgi:hypothetical protein